MMPTRAHRGVAGVAIVLLAGLAALGQQEPSLPTPPPPPSAKEMPRTPSESAPAVPPPPAALPPSTGKAPIGEDVIPVPPPPPLPREGSSAPGIERKPMPDPHNTPDLLRPEHSPGKSTPADMPPSPKGKSLPVTPQSVDAPPGLGHNPTSRSAQTVEREEESARPIMRRLPAFRPIRGGRRTARKVSEHPLLPKGQALVSPLDLPETLTGWAKLVIRKIGPRTAQVGQPIEYTIVVRNLSEKPIRNAFIEDSIPDGAGFVSAEPIAKRDGNRIVWELESIPAGGQLEYKVVLIANSAGILRSTATAGIRFQTETETSVTGPPATLSVTGPDRVATGEQVLFQIRITNTSTQPLKGLLLMSHLPREMNHAAGRDLEAPLPEFKPGESRTIDLPVQAVSAGRGTAEFHLKLPTGGLVSAKHAVVVTAGPELFVKKTGAATVPAGEVVEYRLEVTNTGATPLSSIVVEETLPEEMDFVAASNRGMYDAQTRTVRWEIAELAPGKTQAVALRLRGNRVAQVQVPVRATAPPAVETGLTATISIVSPNRPGGGQRPGSEVIR